MGRIQTPLKIFAGVLTLIASLLLLVWGASPYMSRYVLDDLLSKYAISLSDESKITFNPFFARVHIQDLSLRLSKDGSEKLNREANEEVFVLKALSADVNIWKLLGKEIHFEGFRIDGLNTDITLASNRIIAAGIDLSELEKQSQESHQEDEVGKEESTTAALKIKLPRLLLTNASFNIFYENQDYPLQIKRFELNDLTIIEDTHSLAFSLLATLRETSLDVDLELDGKGNDIAVSSDLSLENFHLSMLPKTLLTDVRELAGIVNISTKTKVSVNDGKTQLSLLDTLFYASELAVAYDKYELKMASIDNSFKRVGIGLDENTLSLDGDLDIASTLLSVSLNDGKSEVIFWQGFESKNIEFSYSQNSSAADIAAKVPDTKVDVLRFSTLKQDSSAKQDESLVAVNRIEVDNLNYDSNSLSIDLIEMAELDANIQLNEEGQLGGLVDFGGSENKTETPQENTKTNEAQTETEVLQASSSSQGDQEKAQDEFGLLISEIRLKGNNQVRFQDQSVQPSLQQNYRLTKVKVGPIDNRDSSQSTHFDLLAEESEYTKIHLVGSAELFADKMNADVNASLNEFSLPSVSPYMKGALGFEMKTGQLDSDLAIKIVEDDIDGKLKLAMRGADFTAADDYQTSSLKDQTSVPLNVALGMLKDGKGNIKLDIPLKGSVADPSFGISSFIALVVKKAVVKASTSYLMKTFVPYSNVISVVKATGEFALKLRFEDLVYAPSSVQVEENQRAYVQQFVQLMKDKPKTQVKVCGIAVPLDIGVNNEVLAKSDQKSDPRVKELLKLATDRQEKFKAEVVGQGGIESSRILLCAPEIDFKQDAKPRVKISV